MKPADSLKSQMKRSTCGNMMLLSTIFGLLAAFAIIVCLGFYMILSHQRRGQTACDEMSISLSKLINSHDRIGQMNGIIERSREMVYLSRQADYAAQGTNIPGYMALSQQLLQESRESAELVEKERENQITYAINECRKFVKQKEDEANGKPKGVFILPWFFEARPTITQVKFGTIKETLSSTESPKAVTGLHTNDVKENYVEFKSNLFRGGVNAKLPSPDDDLAFHFSSLPAEVEVKTPTTNPAVAQAPGRLVETPPRLVNPDVFKPTATIYDKDHPGSFQRPSDLPGAVQILADIGIKTDKNNDKKNDLTLHNVSTATACSALEAP